MFKKIGLYCREHTTRVTLFTFCVIFLALTITNLLNQNLVGDEAVYIVEGDRYIHQPYSFYHNSGSPMVLKVLTALPFSLLPLNRDYGPYYKSVFTNVYTVSEFVYVQNKDWARIMIILARIPHEVIALLLGISIFIFTKRWLNIQIAWIALLLYSFNALILAHAATANLDIGVTAFCFWSLAIWYSYLESEKSPTWYLPCIGVLLGLAQATKISAILLYPVFIVWFIVRHRAKKWTELLSVIAISMLSLWAIYLFQVGPILTTDDTPAGIESVYGSIPIIKEYKSNITQLLYKPIFPLGAYLNNFAYQFSHSFYGHTNYIDGVFKDQGIWYYIPLVFTVKNSVILIFSLFGGLALLFTRKRSQNPLYYYLWLWILLVLFWSIQSKIQLGVRYVMPFYPFMLIAAAAGLWYWSTTVVNQKYAHVVVIILCFWYACTTLWTKTAYFTYISELYKGNNPIDLVFDSDYDWGQDVYLVRTEQKSKNLYPLYFRPYIGGNLSYEHIQSVDDPGRALVNKKNGYYAFSHSSLVNAREHEPAVFTYFYSRKPHYIINRVIYVYKVSFDEK